MSERKVTEEVRLRASSLGIRLFRNNSGVALPSNGNGRPVRYGLGNESKKLNQMFKSSDLIGICPVTITEEMVGKTVGVFMSVEVKKPPFTVNLSDARVRAQYNWLQLIENFGGIGIFASDPDHIDEAIRRFYERYSGKGQEGC